MAALRRANKALVYTVHDLRNPHHDTDEFHSAQLDVLIPAADDLITLTEGAADEIRRRWGREARVIPHPHIVELDRLDDYAERPKRTGDEFRVGVHVKSLRASMNPLPVIAALVELASEHRDLVIQVNGHRDVLEADGAKLDVELSEFLHTEAAAGRIDLRVHDYLSDVEFWDYLASLDASVLPYRFGTHSGWLETCRDVGTRVVAPTCGFYAQQGPVFSYVNDERQLDVASLQAAILAAKDAEAPVPLGAAMRRRERNHIASEHAEIYTRLVTQRERVIQ